MGIDLASQAKRTAVCVIDWSGDGGLARGWLGGDAEDEHLLKLIADPSASKVAIDAPFGFPLPFADALASYWSTGRWPEIERSELRLRATEVALEADFRKAEHGGGQNFRALSSVTDQLVWPAMRCASLLSRSTTGPVQRVGGRIVEVYPGAALRRWLPNLVGPGIESYKGDQSGRIEQREQIVSSLEQKLDGNLTFDGDLRQACIETDDQLDSLVAALVGRAEERGRVEPIPKGSQWLALREGWIVMPTADALAHLV